MLHRSYLAALLGLALAGLSTPARAGEEAWRQYLDPGNSFLLQHPGTTAPELLPDKEPGLLFRVAFEFEQPFQSGENTGSLKFRFQISVWQNTNHLTAGAWAAQHFNPKLILETRPARLAGRDGVVLRTTNLAWASLNNIVADRDRIYELSHMDIAANKKMLPEEVRVRWTATFNRMRESFRLLPAGDK